MEADMERNHREEHYVARVGWLRAAVLGANDGIVSTASLIVGVAAASGRSEVLVAGAAGLAAGALSMAAGEYVSVSSQSDTEAADIRRERAEIAADPGEELRALAGIYQDRGLSPELAQQVAEALHAKGPLAAHVRDELGIFEHTEARPLVAAAASALTFAVGAALPLAVAALAPDAQLAFWVTGLSLVFLAVLGAVGARAGGAGVGRAVARVTFWGAVAMAVTWGVGRVFGAVI
jgi:vacuolar iron transporter family protein